MITRYRILVGSAQWAVTLGQFDIMFAAVAMARYNCLPREGHLQTMLRVFGYLKHHDKAAIRFNLDKPETYLLPRVKHNWNELYGDIEEKLPEDRLEPKGKPLNITTYFDTDYAHDQETRRSVSGIIMYLNKTPVRWYSKRQNTVESSSYGSELVSARIATEQVIEMRYKLMMMDVPIKGSAMVFGDNKSVIVSTSLPSSTLKKKHNAVAYHKVRECVACGIADLIHIPGKENIADVLTKALGPNILYDLVKGVLFGKKDK